MCLVVVAGSKGDGGQLVLVRNRCARLERRTGEPRRAGYHACSAGQAPWAHGTGSRNRSLKPGDRSGSNLAGRRAPRIAYQARWAAPHVKFTAVLPELRRPQGRKPADIGSTPGSMRRWSQPAILATSRFAWASGRIIVTVDGTGTPSAHTPAAMGVLAP